MIQLMRLRDQVKPLAQNHNKQLREALEEKLQRVSALETERDQLDYEAAVLA